MSRFAGWRSDNNRHGVYALTRSRQELRSWSDSESSGDLKERRGIYVTQPLKMFAMSLAGFGGALGSVGHVHSQVLSVVVLQDAVVRAMRAS